MTQDARSAVVTVAAFGAVLMAAKALTKDIDEKPRPAKEPVKPTRASLGSQLSPISEQKTGATSSSSNLEKAPDRPVGLMRAILMIRSMLSDDSASPSLRGPLILLALTLVCRSVGECVMGRLVTSIDQSIIQRKRSFSSLLSKFLLLSIPITACSHLSQFLSCVLAHRLRSRLTLAILSKVALSKVNLRTPEELADAEQLEAMVADAAGIASLIAQLATDRARRFLDGIGHAVTLTSDGSVLPLVVLAGWLTSSAAATKAANAGRQGLAKRAAEKELVVRKGISRLARHKESIAAWDGRASELAMFQRLLKAQEVARGERDALESLAGTVSSLGTRVLGTALGIFIGAQPFLKDSISSIAMPDVFSALWRVRTGVQFVGNFSASLEEDNGDQMKQLGIMTKRLFNGIRNQPAASGPAFKPREGSITLCAVTAVSPTDNSLIFQNLSVELFPGSLMLVTGQKGSGKSAFLRVIMGTWPIVMGEVLRPAKGVYCIPSKPYVVLESSLREQVIYPDPVSSVDSDKLLEAIKVARLNTLFGNSKSGALSDQEQQQLMIGRLVYHQPKFALLDECFKGLDTEFIVEILRYLRARKCAVILATGVAEQIKEKISFDVELNFANRKHELVFKDRTRVSE